MRRVFLAMLFTAILFGTQAMAAVNITATVGNEAPTVGALQLCDGTCAIEKTLDPATQFTIQATITDPNGSSDLEQFNVEFYTTADTNGGTPDWDAVVLSDVSSATADGCTASGDVYCLTVQNSDWTTKFLAGAADIYVQALDSTGAQDANESVGVLTVNQSVGTTQDATSGTYSGAPNSTANAITTDQTKAYIETTHNGNVNIDVTITATSLDKDGDSIPVGNQKYYDSDNYASASSFTGGADTVKSAWERGTYPTSATTNTYLWLDIPADTPAGEYTGTLTYGSSAS